MQLTHATLHEAVTRGIITIDQANQLRKLSSEQALTTPGFRLTHILYYLGGLIAIGAMTLFMTLGWERFGGWGLLFLAFAYGAVGLALTRYLLGRPGLSIPAGIASAFVVSLTPLAVYGLQVALGYWAGGHAYRDYHILVDWRWMLMELATLVVGLAMLWRYRLPFMVMPVAVTLWYMSMDLAPLISHADAPSFTLREQVSMWFGLAMLLLALWTDVRSRPGRDFAFWLYLFGVLAFWGGLSAMHADSERSKFIYLCINLLMIVVGAILSRRVFAVFGALGTAFYLGNLAHGVFKDSMLFPFALTVIGLGIVLLGIAWQRHEAQVAARLQGWLPLSAQAFLRRQG